MSRACTPDPLYADRHSCAPVAASRPTATIAAPS
jgi:hypothetical protein